MKIFQYGVVFSAISFLLLCIGSMGLLGHERRQLEHHVAMIPREYQEAESVVSLTRQIEKCIDSNGTLATGGIVVSALFLIFTAINGKKKL